MHFFFYIRGVYSQVEVWKTLAQGQFWKWKRINLKTGKEETILVQGALRPSILGAWEYILPEDCLADLMSIMGIGSKHVGAPKTFMNKARLAALRKMFGAKKIPEKIFKEAEGIAPSISLNDSHRGLHHLIVKGVAIHPIGIREDERRDFDFSKAGQGKYNQEAL